MAQDHLGIEGYAPTIIIKPDNPERLKYGRMWTHDEYRRVAPGEELAQVFLERARPARGSEVLDFGCGTGRGALMLALLGGLKVTMIDFVRNCLDDDIRQMLTTQAHALRFVDADLEEPLPVAAEYGVCFDTLEHIPPDKVDRVLNNVLTAAQHVFFSIATVDDSCGALIGERLHLTVQPYAWWLKKFDDRSCTIHWSHETDGAALFYVSAWTTAREIVDAGAELNTPEDEIRAHIRHNTTARITHAHGVDQWRQCQPFERQAGVEVLILGGGPSVAECVDEIRARARAGAHIVTLNGAYGWALDHDLMPVTTIMVDAREFNKRFTHPVVDGCVYLLSSQCHPAAFEGLPWERTWIWHTATDQYTDLLDAAYARWWAVPGGSTILLRAIPLLRMLGFSKFHLYGCDSCVSGPSADVWGTRGPEGASLPVIHHAYAQPENDGAPIIPVTCGGRTFFCHAWMLSQAQEFIDLIKQHGTAFEIEVHGDGLLRHILVTGADLQDAVEAASVWATGEFSHREGG